MHTQLTKFDKHSDYWDIRFEITLTDEELTLCHMSSIKNIICCDIELKDHIMSFNYIFFKKNLKENETIFSRFGHIQNCIEHIASSSLI